MSTSQLFRNTFKPNSTCIFDGHLGFQTISNHYGRPCRLIFVDIAQLMKQAFITSVLPPMANFGNFALHIFTL